MIVTVGASINFSDHPDSRKVRDGILLIVFGVPAYPKVKGYKEDRDSAVSIEVLAV